MNDLDKNFEEFKWLDDNNMLIIPFVIKVKINKKSKNIKIINSYKITNKKDMVHLINKLPLNFINRNKKSCLNEWIAHNKLYKFGLFKEHTIECDFTANESMFRRVCYWILSRF